MLSSPDARRSPIANLPCEVWWLGETQFDRNCRLEGMLDEHLIAQRDQVSLTQESRYSRPAVDPDIPHVITRKSMSITEGEALTNTGLTEGQCQP